MINKQKNITFLSLKGKAVINANDGTHLGHVSDLELSSDYRQIQALLLPSPEKFFHLSRKDMMRIPVSQISQIGEDVILVQVSGTN